MPQSQLNSLSFEENGEFYEIYVESSTTQEVSLPDPVYDDSDTGEISMGDSPNPASLRMQQARQTIKGYALNAISAFKDFGAAEIEEVTLKFGMKITGTAGIPYICTGSTDSNLEIQVKCKFPAKNS